MISLAYGLVRRQNETIVRIIELAFKGSVLLCIVIFRQIAQGKLLKGKNTCQVCQIRDPGKITLLVFEFSVSSKTVYQSDYGDQYIISHGAAQ